ncbi:MAG: DUF2809 domain-containing protein [Chloroflexaceae bacterium]
MKRARLIYLAAGIVVVILGLASRAEALPRPALIATYGGDTLWALLVFLLVGVLLPQAATTRVALITLVAAFLIEFSQIYQAPWIVALRQTLPGRLLLGSGFLWSDLVCYTVGVGIGVIAEYSLVRVRWWQRD